MSYFKESDLKSLKSINVGREKFQGGEVTLVGGSSLFHGAPIMALKVLSRMVDMVYFASPKGDKGVVEKIKASLGAFIWVPREDLEEYISKSEVILIGPGMMRSSRAKDGVVCDNEGKKTRDLSLFLFNKFPEKKWVVDGGSLQVVKAEELPRQAVITPNKREFKMLFGEELMEKGDKRNEQVKRVSAKYKVVVVAKDETSVVSDGNEVVVVEGGSEGLTKGGTGDVLAGLISGLLVNNERVLSGAAGNFLVKRAGERLENEQGMMYNAEDLILEVTRVWKEVSG